MPSPTFLLLLPPPQVFLRAPQAAQLERQRLARLTSAAVLLQARHRGRVARRAFLRQRQAAIVVQVQGGGERW